MPIALAALAILLFSTAAQPPETIHATEDEFLRFAVAANLAEVELGQVAAERAASAQVREFGRRMVQDHDSAGRQAKAIADRRQIPVATALDGEHAALKRKLLSLTGPAFDRTFMDAIVDDHRNAAAAFRDEAEHGQDGDIKGYAAKTLPTIDAHRKMAEQIDTTLGTR